MCPSLKLLLTFLSLHLACQAFLCDHQVTLQIIQMKPIASILLVLYLLISLPHKLTHPTKRTQFHEQSVQEDILLHLLYQALLLNIFYALKQLMLLIDDLLLLNLKLFNFVLVLNELFYFYIL